MRAIRRFFLPLNRWYDDLDTEHGVLRMMLFFGFVGLPLIVFPMFLPTYPIVAYSLFALGSILALIRITAFL